MAEKRTDAWRRGKVLRAGRPIWEWLGIWQTHRLTIEFESHRETRASARGQPPYRRWFITFDRDYVDTATMDELEATALHEAIHIAVYEDATEWAETQIEAVTKSRKERAALGQQFGDLQEHAVDLVQRWIVRARSGE